MKNIQLLNRSGLAAIAAVTVLLSTPALAQEAAPAMADPAPIVADEPLTIEPLPAPTPTPEATTDTLAPVASEPAARTTRTTRATAAPAARAPAPARTVTEANSVAPATLATAPAPQASETLPADPAMVAPLPEPVAATPIAPADASTVNDDMLPIAGAAGLGILALAGAGLALRRRRRTDEEARVETEWHEPAMSRPAPVVEPAPVAAAPVAASAFNWSDQRTEHADTNATVAAWDSGSRIEAAKRGPTPDNPSLSLKKRLKRAAFFDQRDRQIAAGTGTPIMADAGLPDAMNQVPTSANRVVKRPAPEPVRRTMPAMSMSFGKTFQPA